MDLTAIAAIGDQKKKSELYKEALDACISSASEEQCKAFVDHSAPLCLHTRSMQWSPVCRGTSDGFLSTAVLLSEVPLVISRQVLHSFVLESARLPAACRKDVALQCASP